MSLTNSDEKSTSETFEELLEKLQTILESENHRFGMIYPQKEREVKEKIQDLLPSQIESAKSIERLYLLFNVSHRLYRSDLAESTSYRAKDILPTEITRCSSIPALENLYIITRKIFKNEPPKSIVISYQDRLKELQAIKIH
ncbi:MAG: hypothetical protein WCX30_00365 [Candidatus Paceibacterota bacterium]|jgi:hypothetical protein|nr:hypothetical protein [bacterium]